MVAVDPEKVRENRLRRMAQRYGYRLEKCRRRDPRSLGYGGYELIDVRINGVVLGSNPWAYSADLDEVEAFLTGDEGTVNA
jgi:hypothetical protein